MGRDLRPDDLPAHDFRAMDLADFIEAISPELKAPRHLGEYLDLLQGLHGGKIRVCVSCPPQHGKTLTVLHAIVWLLLLYPKLRIAYASHGQKFSEEQTRLCRDLYALAGGKFKADFNTIAHWKTEQGGGLIAISWEGSLIGRRVDVMVCDDLIKDSKMAESTEQREHIWRWINGIMTQRLWPGASVVVIGSRWHYDDPSGRLIARGYRELRLPAIREDEHGREIALWPEVKPVAWLDTLRLPSSPDFIGDHDWNAAYMGTPSPRTGSLFGPARFYDELPAGAELVAIGVDIATTASKRSDFSSSVALAHLNGLYYVHDVRRMRQVITDVEATLHEVRRTYPGARMGSYVAGTERGIFDLMFYRGLEVERLPATQSKWARSQRCAIAWKAGRIMVRRNQPWTSTFCREVEFFTGEDGSYDDQVDALVSGYDMHAATAPVGWAAGGFKFGRAVC